METSTAGKASRRAPRTGSPAPQQGGFSLIELIIVLAIMVLVVGIAAPRVAKDMTTLHLRTTAKQVAAALRWARSQALSTGKTYNAVFDCAGQRVIISDYAAAAAQDDMKMDLTSLKRDLEGEESTARPASSKAALKIYELPEDIFISRVAIADVYDNDPGRESIYQMTFFPDGTSMGGEITIADVKDRAFLIAVDFLTGIVSVEELSDT